MDSDTQLQSPEGNNIPVWCVGHHISDPDIHIDASKVDGEGSIGVGEPPPHY